MLLKEAELRVDDLTTAVVHVSYTASSEVKVDMFLQSYTSDATTALSIFINFDGFFLCKPSARN